MANNQKYLYGASVQGIQSFIFQSNELKDIAGASELVEEICKPSPIAKTNRADISKGFDEFITDGCEMIVRAAGNIKCIFPDKTSCENAVKNFPKKVMEMAPGITISQAVVKYTSDNNFQTHIEDLEKKLRIQRNKSTRSTTIGLMGIQRSRKTGLPAVDYSMKKIEFPDKATVEKRKHCDTVKLCEKSFGIEHLKASQVAFDIEDMTQKNDWVAVIHADGNGLGQIIQKIGSDKEKYHNFSENLEKATVEAAQSTFKKLNEKLNIGLDKLGNEIRIPLRPIVLGGDDLTIVCRGDIAVEYVNIFLQEFVKSTQKYLQDAIKEAFGKTVDHLTACAGIAFIKSSYPFYYGYQLAEALCAEAKKDAKTEDHKRANGGMPPSCLMFHKVQDSFVESFKEIKERELTTANGKSFAFGPYYINNNVRDRWTVETLINECSKFQKGKDGSAAKSHLRRWVGAMMTDSEYAQQMLKRAKSIFAKDIAESLENCTKEQKRIVNPDKIEEQGFYPAYDILSYISIINQETKNTPLI